MTKKVIFGAFFHWDSVFHIGSHQYAKQFARNGYKVAYISKSISPLHFLFAREKDVFKEKARIWVKSGQWVENKTIWTYVPLTLIPVHRHRFLTKSWFVKNNNKITIPDILKILLKNNFAEADILFLDEPEEYLLNLKLHKKSVYRVHDDIRHLRKSPSLFEREKRLIKKVDLIVVCSKLMESFIGEMNPNKILYLPNAVDFEHFYLGDDTLPEEYKNIPSPRVIYIGSISEWLDIETLYFAAKNLPKVSFVLIGRPRTDLSKLNSLRNVYILGAKNYSVLPKYMKNSDVGVIPWDSKNNWVRVSHPNKLYMYMACGLPVVATRWKELEHIKSPAYMASTKEVFADYLDTALDDKNKETYIEFARRNSWGSRYKNLMSSIYSKEA